MIKGLLFKTLILTYGIFGTLNVCRAAELPPEDQQHSNVFETSARVVNEQSLAEENLKRICADRVVVDARKTELKEEERSAIENLGGFVFPCILSDEYGGGLHADPFRYAPEGREVYTVPAFFRYVLERTQQETRQAKEETAEAQSALGILQTRFDATYQILQQQVDVQRAKAERSLGYSNWAAYEILVLQRNKEALEREIDGLKKGLKTKTKRDARLVGRLNTQGGRLRRLRRELEEVEITKLEEIEKKEQELRQFQFYIDEVEKKLFAERRAREEAANELELFREEARRPRSLRERREVLRAEQKALESDAAIQIQRLFRGYHDRKYTRHLQDNRVQAALTMQRYYRGFRSRQHTNRMRKERHQEEYAIVNIQRIVRGFLGRFQVRDIYRAQAEELRQELARRQQELQEEQEKLKEADRKKAEELRKEKQRLKRAAKRRKQRQKKWEHRAKEEAKTASAGAGGEEVERRDSDVSTASVDGDGNVGEWADLAFVRALVEEIEDRHPPIFIRNNMPAAIKFLANFQILDLLAQEIRTAWKIIEDIFTETVGRFDIIQGNIPPVMFKEDFQNCTRIQELSHLIKDLLGYANQWAEEILFQEMVQRLEGSEEGPLAVDYPWWDALRKAAEAPEKEYDPLTALDEMKAFYRTGFIDSGKGVEQSIEEAFHDAAERRQLYNDKAKDFAKPALEKSLGHHPEDAPLWVVGDRFPSWAEVRESLGLEKGGDETGRWPAPVLLNDIGRRFDYFGIELPFPYQTLERIVSALLLQSESVPILSMFEYHLPGLMATGVEDEEGEIEFNVLDTHYKFPNAAIARQALLEFRLYDIYERTLYDTLIRESPIYQTMLGYFRDFVGMNIGHMVNIPLLLEGEDWEKNSKIIATFLTDKNVRNVFAHHATKYQLDVLLTPEVLIETTDLTEVQQDMVRACLQSPLDGKKCTVISLAHLSEDQKPKIKVQANWKITEKESGHLRLLNGLSDLVHASMARLFHGVEIMRRRG